MGVVFYNILFKHAHSMNEVVVLAPRTGNAHFLFSSGTEQRLLFLEREEKGLHGGLQCAISAQNMTRVESLASVRKQ